MYFTFMNFGEKWTEIISQYISWILNTVHKFKMIVPYSKWLNGWTVTYLVAATAMIVGGMTANFYDRHRHDCQFMTAINSYNFHYSYMIINYHRRSHSHLFVIIITTYHRLIIIIVIIIMHHPYKYLLFFIIITIIITVVVIIIVVNIANYLYQPSPIA